MKIEVRSYSRRRALETDAKRRMALGWELLAMTGRLSWIPSFKITVIWRQV